MFTGIVTTVGSIVDVDQRDDLRVVIACEWDMGDVDIGASIACSGVCLTVVEKGRHPEGGQFAVDVSAETVRRTVEGMWAVGRPLNLERALKLGDELGGHLVTGHVDTVGRIAEVSDQGGSRMVTLEVEKEYAPFVAPKGSITVDGVSLTVNTVDDRDDGQTDFTVNLIPHTGEVTTLGRLQRDDRVNLEIDTVARDLQRLVKLRA